MIFLVCLDVFRCFNIHTITCKTYMNWFWSLSVCVNSVLKKETVKWLPILISGDFFILRNVNYPHLWSQKKGKRSRLSVNWYFLGLLMESIQPYLESHMSLSDSEKGWIQKRQNIPAMMLNLNRKQNFQFAKL